MNDDNTQVRTGGSGGGCPTFARSQHDPAGFWQGALGTTYKTLNWTSASLTFASGVFALLQMNPAAFVRVLSSTATFISLGVDTLYPANEGTLEHESKFRQIPHALVHPSEHRDYSRFSWNVVSSTLGVLSGLLFRPEDLRNVVRLSTNMMQLHGIHREDQRRKNQVGILDMPEITESSHKPVGVTVKHHNVWHGLQEIDTFRRFAFMGSLISACVGVFEGINRKDPWIFTASACWLFSLAAEIGEKSFRHMDRLNKAAEGQAR